MDHGQKEIKSEKNKSVENIAIKFLDLLKIKYREIAIKYSQKATIKYLFIVKSY